mmetsp:Transcript_29303/g.47054  ORF Transcript_29303/g.47054 Transcript_29303/m.47054 type:complete len:142 (-) Transcript_29303:322-747(-)
MDAATLPNMVLGPRSHVAVTLALLAAQYVLAIVTPNIEVALGFMGSTLSIFVALIVPAAVALAAGRASQSSRREGEGSEGGVNAEGHGARLISGGGISGFESPDGWVAGPQWLAVSVLCFGIVVGGTGLTVATWNAVSPLQ